MKHRKITLLSFLLIYQFLACANAANVTVNSAFGVGGDVTVGVGINTSSFGGACGSIGANSFQDPVNMIGGPPCAALGTLAPPPRAINNTDAAGNSVSALSEDVLIGGGLFKAYGLFASTTRTTKFVFANAIYNDEINFDFNNAFNVNLMPSIDTMEISGTAGTNEIATGSYHMEMSSTLTDSLFSLDIIFESDAPLDVDFSLSNYVAGLPGWNELALENQLSTLLDASNTNNIFSLSSSFLFPNIPFQVAAGEDLTVLSSANVKALSAVPIPPAILLFVSGLSIFYFAPRLLRTDKKMSTSLNG